MNHHQMRQILDQAFRDRAPDVYQKMECQNELATYLDSLTGEAMESIHTATEQQIMDLMKIDNPMQRVQQAEMNRKAAEEVALSQALEAMPLEQTEDEDEPNEPMSLYEQTNDESLLSINRVR